MGAKWWESWVGTIVVHDGIKEQIYINHFTHMSIDRKGRTKMLIVNGVSGGMVYSIAYYFLLCNKKSRSDFDDKLKVGDVRYKHLTQITIEVQLF